MRADLHDAIGWQAEIARRVIGAAQSNNAVDNRKRIPRTVIDLVEQPMLGCLEYLNFTQLGDIDLGGEKIDKPALVVVDRASALDDLLLGNGSHEVMRDKGYVLLQPAAPST